MTNRRLLPLAAALLCGLAAGARADDGEPISTDRPGFAESSQTVGRGRLQLETSLQWDRQRDDELHTRTLSTPTLLRIGLDERTELRIETDGRTVVHAVEPSSGVHTTVAGYADTELGIKWHLADEQGEGLGGRPSMGLLLHAALPSGSSALRGHGLRPSLRLASDWELAGGYSFSLMPGLGIDSDERGKRYGYGILAANLGREFNERLRGFVELAAPQIARASHGGTQASVDAGLAYLVNKDCQLDVSLIHGLDRRSPDLSLAVGLSLRR
jgi:Putative MetA-pathway of phenol degradation